MDQLKKRNKSALIIILIVVVFAVAGFFVLKKPAQKPAEDVTELFAALNAEGETSIQLIDKAVEDKKLDDETALVYKIYAIFGDDRLPAEYTGNKFFRDGTAEVREMIRGWNEFSDNTKTLLEPYTKRPDEEGSWMNLRFGDSADSGETSWLYGNAHATRANAYTEFFTSTDGKVKIWYPNVSGTMNNIYTPGTTVVSADTGKQMAKRIKGFLDRDEIIARFESLLGGKQLMSDGVKGGDGKLDIYVAPCGSSLGLTFPEGSTPTPSYIIMNYGIGLNRDTVLKTTLAHEIFHSFQYAYKYDDVKDNWWGEATAVWSEDYIYPYANTEHGWLPRFIPHPATQADKETPPSEHHYGAYILAYFMTDQFGDDSMRESWEYCDGSPCLDGIDQIFDGGFEKQWKEFTLWNYNAEPAQYYMDWGPFPLISSASSQDTESVMIMMDGEHEIEAQELKPLSADLSDAVIALDETSKAKKIVFKDLRNFTGKTDKAGLKAVIYYKNGKSEVEDWTDKNQRSFCIENKDEDLDHIVLIFSNADMKKNIEASKIKAVTKNSCFEISQEDKRTAVLHMPYMNAGASLIADINTTTDTLSEGETTEDAPDEAKFGYQTKWKIWYEFEQIRDAFSLHCGDSEVDYEAGWITRAAGYLEFDLNPDNISDDGSFPIDLLYGYAHPRGIYEEIPNASAKCIGVGLPSGKIDVTQYKGTLEGIYTGKITDMTADGAKIEVLNSCMYHHCDMQDGSRFQDISEPIILNIKKTEKM